MNIRKSAYLLVIIICFGLTTVLGANRTQQLTFTSGDQNASVPSLAKTPRDVRPISGLIIFKLRSGAQPDVNGLHKRQQTLGINAIDRILSNYRVEKIHRTFPHVSEPVSPSKTDLTRIYSLQLTGDDRVDNAIERLRARPEVEYAERVYPRFTTRDPNDPNYTSQAHLNTISAAAGWDIETGDSSVVIGIIDTGVDWEHEDLRANIWTNADEIPDNGVDDDGNGYTDDIRGWDFVDVAANPNLPEPAEGEDGDEADNNPDDFDGHGTHCAGIAAAVTDNSTGIAGTSWNTTIMPVRAGYRTADDNGTVPWGFFGIVYAVDNGADILSLSWGGGGMSAYEQEVINYAWENGTVIISSAGNAGDSVATSPGIYDNVLSVGATGTQNDNIASYSNYGEWVDIMAPGSGIYSTLPDNSYGYLSGTSMSTPMVAGLAGLIKSRFPGHSNHDIALQIAGGANNIDAQNPDFEGQIGFGRINLVESLNSEKTVPPNLEVLAVLDDEITGNGNGIAEPGETVEMQVILENQFLGGSADNLTLTLHTEDGAITIQNEQISVPGIQPLDSISTAGSSFLLDIAPTSIPHRANFTLDITSDNGYSSSVDISRPIGRVPVLLVDDDDGANNVESYYTEVLDSLGIPFAYWDHTELGTPVNQLGGYANVIWLCEWAFPSLTATDRSELDDYLDQEGNLFLSGQDIGWDLNTPFTGQDSSEYTKSNGQSQVWYETNLGAIYQSDDASETEITDVTGISGNFIGDGLDFSISQPGRSAEYQFPDVVSPTEGATGIFRYEDGGAAATMVPGESRVVYFGFGFEAIRESGSRLIVMDRILQWLNDFSIQHRPISDTENLSDPQSVVVSVSDPASRIDSMAVYWSTSPDLPHNITRLSQQSDSVYIASIPPQPESTTIHYFIYAAAGTGFFRTSPHRAPSTMHSYYTGEDEESPVISEATEIMNTIDNSGVYPVNARISDNLGVDTSKVYLHYRLNSQQGDSTLMTEINGTSQYSGVIQFGSSLSDGDTVTYYISAVDNAEAENRTMTTVKQFTIVSNLLIDDFETALTEWESKGRWERDSEYAHTGSYSITESPGDFYDNETDYILTNKRIYDLSGRSSGSLSYWHKFDIHESDGAYVEVSRDGETWERVRSYNGDSGSDFREGIAPLADYMDADSLRFRFRISTDEDGTADGWFIDDVRLLVDTTVVGVEDDPVAGLPDSYALNQNYPNPFNPVTNIQFAIPEPAEVKLIVFNLLGQQVATLLDEPKQAGRYTVQWRGVNDQGRKLGSGVYFYRLQTENYTRVRKMVFMK